jgi:hypothetical protein
MSASGTGLWGLLAFMEIATVPTAPDYWFVFFEDFASLDIGEEPEVPFFVLLFSDRNILEDL